jgi:hypothetical protein
VLVTSVDDKDFREFEHEVRCRNPVEKYEELDDMGYVILHMVWVEAIFFSNSSKSATKC